MSETINTGFKKQHCGDQHQLAVDKVQAHVRDVLGGLVDLLLVGTDPDVDQPIDAGALVEDYYPGGTPSTVDLDPDGNGYPRVNPDGTFFICIESDDGIYHVTLADGSAFTITAIQSAAYVGQWYPARIVKVLTGSSGSFSVGY